LYFRFRNKQTKQFLAKKIFAAAFFLSLSRKRTTYPELNNGGKYEKEDFSVRASKNLTPLTFSFIGNIACGYFGAYTKYVLG
jgi:hypothetical protein